MTLLFVKLCEHIVINSTVTCVLQFIFVNQVLALLETDWYLTGQDRLT